MTLLTIFTPTYNRANLLPNLYTSLCAQTNKNFVWLIIDDGSTDNTAILVSSWIDENTVDIKYVKQENMGKPSAHNKGVDLCNTELFFCVDSDDKLTEDAVQTIADLYEEEKGYDILGFIMRKGTFDGQATGSHWPVKTNYTYINDLYQKHGFRGEVAIILKTELIKPYSFPIFDKEKFITETIFYDQINNIAQLRLKNKVCYLYEYCDDGYTVQSLKLHMNNPIGTGFNYLNHIRYTSNILEKCKLMGMFYAWKNLTNASAPIYKTIRHPIYIRILGILLKAHYKKLFIEYKKE